MDQVASFAEVQFQRARSYGNTLVLVTALFIPSAIVDGASFNSWVSFGLTLFMMAMAIGYRVVIKPHILRPTTLIFLLIQMIVLSGVVHNSGSFLSYNIAFYCLALFGAGFILVERTWIIVATAMTVITASTVAALEMTRTLLPNKPAAIILQTSGSYQGFALASQIVIIIGTGMIISIVMQLVQRREHDLYAARIEAAERSAALNALADQLEATNAQLKATEINLRTTVDALTVTALPLADGMLVLPLIGAFDQHRANAVIERLLATVYTSRATIVILDMTGIATATPTLLHMLERIIGSVRLLGARVVLAGLQPDVAPMLIALKFDLSHVRSAPTLAGALAEAGSGKAVGTKTTPYLS